MLRSLPHPNYKEQSSLFSSYRHFLRTNNTPNNPHAFPLLLKSLSKSKSTTQTHQIHAHIVKLGFSSDPFTASALLNVYSKLSDTANARKLFDEMPLRNVVSSTSMLCAYVRDGNLVSASEIFHDMPDKDSAAYNAMIDGFVKSGDLVSARKVFDEMPAMERNVVTWTSLVSGYARVGNMASACVLFDEMPVRNLVSWNAMIGGFCKNNMPERALELFRELTFRPDDVTLVSVIPAVASIGAIDLGRWIHRYARSQGLDRCANVATALVDMYFKCGDVDEAIRVFESIADKETVSWNSMINGLAVNGRPKDALHTFHEMKKSGACINEVTMLGVLSACSHGGLVDEGRKWFFEMDTLRVLRRVDHYGCMIDLLGRAGYLREAEELLDEMPWAPNGIILSSLLFACWMHKDVVRAKRVMRAAEKVESGNVRNYVIMRNLYAEAGMWGDAEKAKEAIQKSGGKTEVGCSVIEVGGKSLEFVSGDRAHPESEVIYGMLRDLNMNVKGDVKEALD